MSCRPVGNVIVGGVEVSFLHRDAALVNDREMENIHQIIAAERESLRWRSDEVLTHLEFISDDVYPGQCRYNTVSQVAAGIEDMYDG